jgi:hypothetical protein
MRLNSNLIGMEKEADCWIVNLRHISLVPLTEKVKCMFPTDGSSVLMRQSSSPKSRNSFIFDWLQSHTVTFIAIVVCRQVKSTIKKYTGERKEDKLNFSNCDTLYHAFL